MIELFYASTPNAWKVSIFLEEAEIPYRVTLVDIRRGEQFKPEFLAVSPNNRIPAIADHDPADGGDPITVFESGAILEYLGEKTGRFFPRDPRRRAEVQQWLFWQMAGLGPMVGQANHFIRYAPERLPYATQRYVNEVWRLHAVLDRRLADRPYVAGDEFTIADMANYPWAAIGHMQNQDIANTPNLKAWLDRVASRPGVKRSAELAEKHSLANREMTEDERKVLIGQSAETVRQQDKA